MKNRFKVEVSCKNNHHQIRETKDYLKCRFKCFYCNESIGPKNVIKIIQYNVTE